MRTATDMRKEADQIEANLDSGKIHGKKTVAKMRFKMSHLRYRAKKKDAKPAAKSKVNRELKAVTDFIAKAAPVSKRAPKIPLIVMEQGKLPGFLSQLSVVRIEEMIADRLFRSIETVIVDAVKKAI